MKRLSCIVAILTGCGGGGGGHFFFGDLAVAPVGGDMAAPDAAGDMAVQQMPPDLTMREPLPDFAQGLPDLTQPPPDLTQVQKKPVGATCASSLGCSGPNAQCYLTLPSTNYAAPGGYCSNKPCVNNNDCGNLGFCADWGGGNKFCLGSCTMKNECQQTNANNRCFDFDLNNQACLPAGVSKCDPTSAQACIKGECQRGGPDNVGFCYTLCNFGGACAADSQGNPRECYMSNNRIDLNGKLTGDYWAGLVCLTDNGNLAPNAACVYENDCQNGYECNVYQLNGTPKLCKKLCRNGSADCIQGTTCQDGFKLAGSWVFGAIGLCL